MLTGTDEHGQKIEQSARKNGQNPKDYVDVIAQRFKNLWDSFGIGYDYFIRTTDENHEATIQKIFKRFYDQGDIYKSRYEGLYCVPCESFFTETQVTDGLKESTGVDLQSVLSGYLGGKMADRKSDEDDTP